MGVNNLPRSLRSFVPLGIEPTTYWSQVQRHTATPPIQKINVTLITYLLHPVGCDVDIKLNKQRQEVQFRARGTN